MAENLDRRLLLRKARHFGEFRNKTAGILATDAIMTTPYDARSERYSSGLGPRRLGAVGRLRTLAQLAIAWIKADIRRRRGRAELERLDDRLLRDIGLTRHDIDCRPNRVFSDDR